MGNGTGVLSVKKREGSDELKEERFGENCEALKARGGEIGRLVWVWVGRALGRIEKIGKRQGHEGHRKTEELVDIRSLDELDDLRRTKTKNFQVFLVSGFAQRGLAHVGMG